MISGVKGRFYATPYISADNKGSSEMTREFIMTTVYDKLWDRLGLTDEDLGELQSVLLKNPASGDIIQGTGGARKIRFALLNIGKSGGIRVIYIDLAHKAHTHLLLSYPKSKQDDLTEDQKKQLKQAIKILKGE